MGRNHARWPVAVSAVESKPVMRDFDRGHAKVTNLERVPSARDFFWEATDQSSYQNIREILVNRQTLKNRK
jgi:hypothetical protein